MKRVLSLVLAMLWLTTAAVAEVSPRELLLESDGQRIYGKLWLPEGEGEHPLVILCHGLGVTHRSCVNYAEALSEQGVAAYCFDFRGGGDGSASEGAVKDMTLLTEIADLEAVLSAAADWESIDPDRVALMGFSQGGLVSALMAARHPDQVAGLVLCYPAFNIPEYMRYQSATAEDFPESFDFGWVRVGHQYGVDAWDIDPYAEIRAYDKPVLLLHGDRDNLVPMMYTTRALQTYPDARAEIIRGAGHGFEGAAFDQAMETTLAYLKDIGLMEQEG